MDIEAQEERDLLDRIVYHIFLVVMRCERTEDEIVSMIAEIFRYDLPNVFKLAGVKNLMEFLVKVRASNLFIFWLQDDGLCLVRVYFDILNQWQPIAGFPYSGKLRIIECIQHEVYNGVDQSRFVTEHHMRTIYKSKYGKELDHAEIKFLFCVDFTLQQCIESFMSREVVIEERQGRLFYGIRGKYGTQHRRLNERRAEQDRCLSYWCERIRQFGRIPREVVRNSALCKNPRIRNPLPVTKNAQDNFDCMEDPWEGY